MCIRECVCVRLLLQSVCFCSSTMTLTPPCHTDLPTLCQFLIEILLRRLLEIRGCLISQNLLAGHTIRFNINIPLSPNSILCVCALWVHVCVHVQQTGTSEATVCVWADSTRCFLLHYKVTFARLITAETNDLFNLFALHRCRLYLHPDVSNMSSPHKRWLR